jgi:hypothetical protein
VITTANVPAIADAPVAADQISVANGAVNVPD